MTVHELLQQVQATAMNQHLNAEVTIYDDDFNADYELASVEWDEDAGRLVLTTGQEVEP